MFVGFDLGFRQITTSTKPINTPDDLRRLKLRVPSAPMLSTLFAALGASPTPINFNEVYSALQTKLVEGQENPLAIIATADLNVGEFDSNRRPGRPSRRMWGVGPGRRRSDGWAGHFLDRQ